MSYTKPNWKIEIKTGDDGRTHPEWVELHGYNLRFRYVDREEAESMLAKLQRTQPHGTFRVAPV